MQTQSTLNRWAIVDETQEYTTAPEGPVEKELFWRYFNHQRTILPCNENRVDPFYYRLLITSYTSNKIIIATLRKT